MSSVYGVVTMPFTVREGINVFLNGKVSTENLRFREESLTFEFAETAENEKKVDKFRRYQYPDMKKTLGKSLIRYKINFSHIIVCIVLY